MLNSMLAVAASRIIVDARTNQVSIIDVFEGLKAQSFPIVIPNMMFLFQLRRDIDDESENKLSIQCLIDNQEIIKASVNIDFNEGKTTRTIIGFDGFVIPSAGELTIKLMKNESELGKLVFPIGQLDVPPPQVHQANDNQ